MTMNLHAVRAIFRFEMARTRRTLMQSIISPVISTSLYFVVFGAAIGSRIQEIGGISYGSFIVPGLIMLSLLTQSIANGCSIRSGTKSAAVARMITPTMIDLVAAAPT